MNASRDIITVRNLSELTLKEVDVQLEAVNLPHLDGEEVMVVLLGLPAGEVLSEKRFDDLLEAVRE